MKCAITKNLEGRYVATMMILSKKLNAGEFNTEVNARIGLLILIQNYFEGITHEQIFR